MSEDQRQAWRKALADLHKQQRRDRWKRKTAPVKPGMVRRAPAPVTLARAGKARDNDQHGDAGDRGAAEPPGAETAGERHPGAAGSDR